MRYMTQLYAEWCGNSLSWADGTFTVEHQLWCTIAAQYPQGVPPELWEEPFHYMSLHIGTDVATRARQSTIVP